MHRYALIYALCCATAFGQYQTMPTRVFAPDTLRMDVMRTIQPDAGTGYHMLAGVAMLLVANVSDYLLQADAHGWENPAWENGSRAPHWHWALDWIPHDGWHVTQSARNLSLVLGSMLVYEGGGHILRAIGIEPTPIMRGLVVWAAFLVTRGVGFSVPLKLLN